MAKGTGWGLACTLVSLALGLGRWWIQVKGVITPANADILLYLAAPLFLAGIGLVVWSARLWIRRRIFRRRDREEAAGLITKPGLQVEAIEQSNYGRAGGRMGLKIWNGRLDMAENCSGQLVLIDFVTSQENRTLSGWPTEHRLRWMDEPSGIRHIDAGAKAVLEVIYWELLISTPSIMSPTYISYVGDEEFRRSHGVHLEWGGVLLVISVTCTGMMPRYVACVLDKEYSGFGYKLQLLAENLSQCPTVDRCRRLVKPDKAQGADP